MSFTARARTAGAGAAGDIGARDTLSAAAAAASAQPTAVPHRPPPRPAAATPAGDTGGFEHSERKLGHTGPVARNAKGGIAVSEDELRAAFQFLDMSGTGKVTIQDLKKRLGPFYRTMPMREFKFLMGGETELTLDALRDLLCDNEITDFDPVAEAFKVYDPAGTGFADIGTMRAIFSKLGFEDLSDEDVQILIETADMDGDGRISLTDFRRMMEMTQDKATS